MSVAARARADEPTPVVPVAAAPAPSPSWRAFVGGGVGGAILGWAGGGPTFDAGLSVTRGETLYRLRVAGAQEIIVLTTPEAYVVDVSALYGRWRRNGNLIFSGALGPGYTYVQRRGEFLYDDAGGVISVHHYRRLTHHTVGVAVDGQFLFAGRTFGAGLAVAGNLNLYVPVASLLAIVEIGAL